MCMTLSNEIRLLMGVLFHFTTPYFYVTVIT